MTTTTGARREAVQVLHLGDFTLARRRSHLGFVFGGQDHTDLPWGAVLDTARYTRKIGPGTMATIAAIGRDVGRQAVTDSQAVRVSRNVWVSHATTGVMAEIYVFVFQRHGVVELGAYNLADDEAISFASSFRIVPSG